MSYSEDYKVKASHIHNMYMYVLLIKLQPYSKALLLQCQKVIFMLGLKHWTVKNKCRCHRVQNRVSFVTPSSMNKKKTQNKKFAIFFSFSCVSTFLYTNQAYRDHLRNIVLAAT